eukprot:TRINITY_DN45471_c0_g1_i1.p3 TRINITY_DN45471_c0_g1~~TRINITY_DN45471_c0_g1_i1.p3  ORF type:complete len:127 (-),score=24.39 TRINITY_DN45471_c0_g1_i1:362-742(-)
MTRRGADVKEIIVAKRKTPMKSCSDALPWPQAVSILETRPCRAPIAKAEATCIAVVHKEIESEGLERILVQAIFHRNETRRGQGHDREQQCRSSPEKPCRCGCKRQACTKSRCEACPPPSGQEAAF